MIGSAFNVLKKRFLGIVCMNAENINTEIGLE